MRKLAIGIALASTMLATPAVARDGSLYAGIEGGLMLVEDLNLDYDDDIDQISEAIIVNHKTGYDIDGIVGYDFGMVRVEGELGYKRASVDCRDYTHTVYIEGKPRTMKGTACRNPDGTWKNMA